MMFNIPPSIMTLAADSLVALIRMLIEHERAVEGYTDNPEELEATNEVFDAIINNVSCEVQGNTIVTEIKDSGMPWQETMESGMDAPMLGGSNGVVTLPDGSTRPSRVPKQFWGTQRIEEFKTAAYTWKENVTTIYKSLARSEVIEVIKANVSAFKDQATEFITGQLAVGGATA